MINLPQISLVVMRGLNYQNEEHWQAIKKSTEKINFGAVVDIQLGSIIDIDSWNYAVIYELSKYVNTTHCLFIHSDGYVINPSCWNEDWTQFDFIGAPWPLPRDEYSYRDESGDLVRVGNSVSLRSKKLLDLIATRPKELFWWPKMKYGNCNEDGFITCHNRKWLESQGCKFAPLEVAVHFSKEHEIPENKNIKTFMFHAT